MKFLATFAAIGLFAGLSLAQDTVQVAHVTLRSIGDDHSYPLDVPADGKAVLTYSSLPIQHIDAPDFNVLQACVIETAGEANLSSTIAADGVTQQVVIDPPQAVTSITCQGTCVATYGACYAPDGSYVGACCNGMCIASHCKPWNIGSLAYGGHVV
ncbi:hypothetical protein V8C42DRAFT_316392 [Trichoderma barbatum]